ncbi:MAG: amino acid ABC transporter substrate-binding protein [Burkholderiales bacterium PBB3]|nr:MAG: amino acid ABC transporter substrate-binding protein [Burkholderiales bacterium PBB3]
MTQPPKLPPRSHFTQAARGAVAVLRLALACLCLQPLTSGAAETLTFCYESVDVRPWRTVEGTGLNFDLINAAAAKLGIQIKYEGIPWKRCLSELKANRMDGAFGVSFKTDRLDTGVYPGGSQPDDSKRLFTDGYMLLRNKGSKVTWDGKSIGGLEGAVGIQLGYSVGDQLRSMNIPVDDGSINLRELVRKLVAGRIGAAAIGGSDATYLSSKEPTLAKQFEILPIPLVQKPYFLMLSHQVFDANPERALRFWKAIETERKSAAYVKREQAALQGLAR